MKHAVSGVWHVWYTADAGDCCADGRYPSIAGLSGCGLALEAVTGAELAVDVVLHIKAVLSTPIREGGDAGDARDIDCSFGVLLVFEAFVVRQCILCPTHRCRVLWGGVGAVPVI